MLDIFSDSGVGILFLGLMIGMQHALEADHVAAVSSIAARQNTLRKIVTHGAFWGVGHTVTLGLVAGFFVILGLTFNKTLENCIELIVGIMLMGIGGKLIFVIARERIHFHQHLHEDGTNHFHVHSHRYEKKPHNYGFHRHTHTYKVPVRTIIVGMVHGLAGSAALLVLTATTVHSVPLGLLYIFIFGIGSLMGMMALSAVIAVPITWSLKALNFTNTTLQVTIGTATIILGTYVAFDNSKALSI
ncbi:MAG: urease accessory protein [Rhodospirillaceae bacterium]|nr:urease accessory protein [Rhodospirillaceae bacterium]